MWSFSRFFLKKMLKLGPRHRVFGFKAILILIILLYYYFGKKQDNKKNLVWLISSSSFETIFVLLAKTVAV